jgi:hypothetical protein
MSYTGTEIYEMAIVILDELTDTGTVSDSQSKEYRYRAPRLLDMWQHEAAKNGRLEAIEEYENTDEDNVNKWTKLTLPANINRIKDVIFEDADSQPTTINYKRFGKTDIYFYFTQTGTARVLYIPIPEKITDLAQTIEISEDCAISGAYYLAEHFAMADQNDELAARCRQKYAELKGEDNRPNPITTQEIEDVYGISSRM